MEAALSHSSTAASLPSSSSKSFRLDLLECESIPKAIIVAKEMQDSDLPKLVSRSHPEPGLEAGDEVRYESSKGESGSSY